MPSLSLCIAQQFSMLAKMANIPPSGDSAMASTVFSSLPFTTTPSELSGPSSGTVIINDNLIPHSVAGSDLVQQAPPLTPVSSALPTPPACVSSKAIKAIEPPRSLVKHPRPMNVLRVFLSSTKVDPNLRKFIGWRVSVAEAAPSLDISKEPPVPAAPSFHQFAAFVAPDSADPIRHFYYRSGWKGMPKCLPT
jgi:hypothetical protein